MKSQSFSYSLVPSDLSHASFKYYLTFANADGCKIHVPMTVSNQKLFRLCAESQLLEDLKRKMSTFSRAVDPEYGPLLRPNEEFFLKTNIHPYTLKTSTSEPSRLSNRLKASRRRKNQEEQEKALQQSDGLGDAESSTSFIDSLPSCPKDLKSLELFSKAFMAKRAELNLAQKDVALSLRTLYGLNRSATLISRIERMDLSLSNFLRAYPVLLQWMKDTESVKTRNAIIRAAHGEQPDTASCSSTASVSKHFPQRRRRTVFSNAIKGALKREFYKNISPSRSELAAIASQLQMDYHVVKIWFRNQRVRWNAARRKVQRDD